MKYIVVSVAVGSVETRAMSNIITWGWGGGWEGGQAPSIRSAVNEYAVAARG